MDLVLHESCAGAMALSSHLCGNTVSLMPNWGSKWRYRRELESIARGLLPDCSFSVRLVIGTDPGGWGSAANVLFDAELRALVIEDLKDLMLFDPEDNYSNMHNEPCTRYLSNYDSYRVARFLYMSRIAYGNKPVRWLEDGTLISPGYNKTSAEGTPATERFGEVKPQLPGLLKRLESLSADVPALIRRVPMGGLDFAAPAARSDSCFLELIDPPYVGTTPYPHSLERNQVVRRALRQQALGWAVMVCETEPIPDLIAEGWQATEITRTRNGGSAIRSHKREFVTYKDGYT